MALNRIYQPFKLRRFTIEQQHNAMKVGTDAMLLGLLATTPHSSPRILEVGSGTSIVSLLLAQRYDKAFVRGVEIDPLSASEGLQNVMKSPFANRVTVENLDFRKYSSNELFNFIVSNPPYYSVSHSTPDHRRNIARHSCELSANDLFAGCIKLLKKDGKLTIIIPVNTLPYYVAAAREYGFAPCDITYVVPRVGILPRRAVISFVIALPCAVACSFLTLEKERDSYTLEYRNLLKPFVLDRYLR